MILTLKIVAYVPVLLTFIWLGINIKKRRVDHSFDIILPIVSGITYLTMALLITFVFF